MAKRADITPEVLRQLLDYDPASGLLTWKERGPQWFADGYRTAQGNANVWNSKWAGQPTLNHICKANGYRHGAVFAVMLQSHRVVWAIVHGEWPPLLLDHVNGDKADNRLENLRSVSHQGNMQNMARYSSNKSGTMGVHWDAGHKAWAATIGVNGKPKRIGRFKDIGQAVTARKLALISLGYHENHGRVA